MVEAIEPEVVVKLLKGYQFQVTFPGLDGAGFTMDEPPPLGDPCGPNASRLLAASVADCLSSSLLFCLRKSRVEVEAMETEANPMVEPNSEGYWRVQHIDVGISAKLRDEAGRERAKRCLEIFERYCIVTDAVRDGIQVEVNVRKEAS